MTDLRDTIARAIYTSKEFAAAAAFGVPIDAKTVCAEGIADAVIAALGLTDAYGRATDGMVNQLEAMQKEENDG